jgi:hypothetical protein
MSKRQERRTTGAKEPLPLSDAEKREITRGPVMAWHYGKYATIWLPGQPPRKSNQRVLRTNPATGKPLITRSDKAIQWEAWILTTMPSWCKFGAGGPTQPLAIDALCFYGSNLPDLSTEAIQDCLQRAGVITNDRYVLFVSASKIVDKHLQGALVTISDMDNPDRVGELSCQTLVDLLSSNKAEGSWSRR